MAKGKWEHVKFSNEQEDPSYIVVDDRISPAKNEYSLNMSTIKIKRKSMLSFRFTPKIIIPVSEGLPPDAAEQLAKTLCKLLQADWVRDELEGGNG